MNCTTHNSRKSIKSSKISQTVLYSISIYYYKDREKGNAGRSRKARTYNLLLADFLKKWMFSKMSSHPVKKVWDISDTVHETLMNREMIRNHMDVDLPQYIT